MIYDLGLSKSKVIFGSGITKTSSLLITKMILGI